MERTDVIACNVHEEVVIVEPIRKRGQFSKNKKGRIHAHVSNLILTLAIFIILLILPFFLPEINSRCSLASSTWNRISW